MTNRLIYMENSQLFTEGGNILWKLLMLESEKLIQKEK
jgi:hypothetical protein